MSEDSITVRPALKQEGEESIRRIIIEDDRKISYDILTSRFYTSIPEIIEHLTAGEKYELNGLRGPTLLFSPNENITEIKKLISDKEKKTEKIVLDVSDEISVKTDELLEELNESLRRQLDKSPKGNESDWRESVEHDDY